MKKQFNRMRQLANQTVGRAEKTEVLSDDLLQIERRMELVRLVSHNTHKKLVSCLQGQLGTDTEKRHKKLPLTGLSQTMQEGGGQLGDESLIGKMMDVCGEAESRLATELMQHELQLERDILDPLNQLAEVEIPNILKQRKQLAKLVLDYDSAKTRWYQATKSNNQAMAAKVDSLKDEMEEALNKVEICKDQLSADMYSFSSKEGEHARYYILLHQYFLSNREIALPIEACVMMLLETGMKEEGLFRIAAGASKLKKLKAALDCSTSQLEEFYSDPHAVAGALKSYLRELPEPLMTFGLYDEWIQASNVSDPDKRLQDLWVTCDRLPKTHKANLRYLVKFLAKLALDSEVNKMTPSNISIVLGPNLLWPNADGSLAEMAAATSVHVVSIIELVIQHADWFFPDGKTSQPKTLLFSVLSEIRSDSVGQKRKQNYRNIYSACCFIGMFIPDAHTSALQCSICSFDSAAIVIICRIFHFNLKCVVSTLKKKKKKNAFKLMLIPAGCQRTFLEMFEITK
uniref:Rho GTPase-activating protein 17 n=1 Tax=Amphiprion ocellaris TaxID=80972 RepID=A0AAQ5XXV7_AMPOC